MPATDITLYAYIFPSRAERVIWTLEELGMDYQLNRLNPLKGETRSAEFLALNPGSKVPVLLHGDKVLTESLAIMEYLVTISGKTDLLPSAIDAQYEYRRLIYYGVSEVEAYLWLAEQASALKALYNWPEACLPEARARAAGAIAPVWESLRSREYIIGTDFTLLDIYYQHLSRWTMRQGTEADAQVLEWLARVEGRPAFSRGDRLQ